MKALEVANENLITQFQNKFYKQKRGLAMGVADSPDISMLYGMYFEEQCKIMEHPDVPYYGRYIDDCLAIVYAESEAHALSILSIVQFDDCVIEWTASDHFQVFLDMLLYVDGNRQLQHRPYRKAQSHQERIPWISHHPIDVKRGTFIGEMSRLATLSSLYSHYLDAVKGLATLYISRGYPQDLVYKWLKDNITERWEKRLNEVRPEPRELLVLKSYYNTTWNYFNAKELGDTVLGYWRTWLEKAERNEFSIRYPKFSGDLGDIAECRPRFTTEVRTSEGPKEIPDIRKIGILNRRMIVSRKRTRNLFDMTSLWKKTVLAKMDSKLSEPLSEESDDMDVDMKSDISDSEGRSLAFGFNIRHGLT
jgi:hypothetical protein